MKIMNVVRALLVVGLTLGAAMSARAAGPYTLTCDAARSGTVTIALTGYTVSVTGTSESALGAGKAAERRETKFALTVQTSSGKDYETLLSMLQDDEMLRSCKLIDGQGGAGIAANDNWNAGDCEGKEQRQEQSAAIEQWRRARVDSDQRQRDERDGFGRPELDGSADDLDADDDRGGKLHIHDVSGALGEL